MIVGGVEVSMGGVGGRKIIVTWEKASGLEGGGGGRGECGNI
jgi:hypothetical protein